MPRLIQFIIAGVDFIPLGELPEGVPVATNGGGYAESMAEHALAMSLDGPCAALLARMAALSCFPVAIGHSDFPGGSRQSNIFGAASQSR